MESMSLEVPVIGTDIRGLRDLLEPGGGILCPVGDVDSLARAMTWMVDHPREAAEMRAAGRKIVRAYDIVQVLRRHEELYAQALAETERGGGVG